MRAVTGFGGRVRRPLSGNEKVPSRSAKFDEPMPWPAEYFADRLPLQSSPLSSLGSGGSRGHRVGIAGKPKNS